MDPRKAARTEGPASVAPSRVASAFWRTGFGLTLAVSGAVALLPWGTRLAAQAPPLLPSTRVVQAGPASLYPAVSLRNVGTDSNVYDEPASPRADFTYSLTPRLYAVVPIAGTRLMGTAAGDFVYYRTYKDQQSVNGFFEARYETLDAPIRPFASASVATHRERHGFEIDARARQTQRTMALGADFTLTPVTSLTGWVRREHTSWDRDEIYAGFSLADQLDFTADIVAAGARLQLTPFTRVVIAAELERDRFEHSPVRDADSVRLAPTVEFDSGAAITGHARAGYRAFKPLDSAVDEFHGLTAAVGLRYELLDATRMHVDGSRDVKYSFDPLQPYYLESGARIRVIQRVVGPFQVVALGERWRLRHQRLGGRSFDGRQEDTTTVGGGVGLRLRKEMELLFTVDRTRRTSRESAARNFERRRAMASISYGL